jgi:hypothetical protein
MTTTGETTKDSTKVVPHVSSSTAGPLGVLHLPRLWAKLTLGAAGRLPEDYDECGPGFDQMTLSTLKLNRDKVMEYLRTHKPTYVQFERWIVEQNGGKIDSEAVQKHNDAVRGYNHGDDRAESIRKACGVTDSNIKDAVTLNNLEDLDALHQQVAGK